MIESPVHPTADEIHKHHPRRLHGVRLWLARGSYLVLFSLVLIFFIAGFQAYLDWWNRGFIGLAVRQGQNGSLIAAFVDPNGDAGSAGVRVGDVLLAVNGVRVSSVAQADQVLAGRIGDPVTITVQTGSAAPRQYALVYAGRFLQLLASLHLSVRFLFVYNTVFSCLLALGVILSSPLVFLRRSNDWLVILVAFAMIAFASYLLSPVGFGTARLKVLFMNYLIYMVGMVSMIIVFFIYPSGHFEPRWTRWISLLLVVPAFMDFVNLLTIHNSLLDFFLWIGFLALGAFAQLYRYRRVSSPVERQQTKWVVFGAVACFSIIAILDVAAFLLSYILPYTQYLLYQLLINVWATLSILVLDLSFMVAIYRYRLWDTDLYINRTLVYSVVTLFLMAVWILTTQVLNYASQIFFGKQINWLGALVSSLQVAVIYKPVRKWVEKWINNRFYKDRIDYSEALVELRPEMWTYLTPSDLGHTLVTTIPALLQSTSGALFIRERQGMVLTEVHNIHPSDAYKFHFNEETLKKLGNATVLSLPEGAPFALLVPLTVSRLKVYDLVGVLAIGPRPQGRGYSRDHLNDLSALGRNAGTALYMLGLNEKKRTNVIPSKVEG